MADSDTLYKLIILYMLSRVDFPLTNAQISDFILEKDYTDFFTLQSVLADLEDGQMIHTETIRNCSYYTILEAGEEVLKYFHNRISPTIRRELDQYMTDNKIQMRDDVSVLADYYKNTEGDYSVRCVVKEKLANLIDLTITVPYEDQAKAACRSWKEHSQSIYKFVFKELLG
ncbi:MAG: DUF4364 family protein [Lachnospiraceae bacterium]|nr:DUF4364 family protein [Lachnospiraceae bacterium]